MLPIHRNFVENPTERLFWRKVSKMLSLFWQKSSRSRSSRYQSRSWSSRYRSRFRQSRSSWCRFQFSWYRTSRLDLNLNCFDLDLTGIGHDFLGLDLSGIGLPDVSLNFLGIGLPGLISILTVSTLMLLVSVSILILTVLVQSYRF